MNNGAVNIDQLVYSVTLIETYVNTCKVGGATGFFYEKNNEVYLITNKHVVIKESDEYFPSLVKICVHTSITSNIPRRTINIPLYRDNVPTWLEHPTIQGVDVVAINIEEFIEESDVIFVWSREHFKENIELVTLGQSVIVMGYPHEFHDTMHYLPICRSGTIASTYGANFLGEPHFLVDATLHEGTSGSPTYLPIRYFRETLNGAEIGRTLPPTLLGINSGEYEGLKLNAIWYARLIEEIID